MESNKQYLVSNPKDFGVIIDDVLSEASKDIDKPLVLALEGDLGAGKTTFVQNLAQQLGVEDGVNSPTFTIMKQYSVSGVQFDRLVHIDAYRIETDNEVAPLHFDDLFKRPKTIVCIEWPENIKQLIPAGTIKLTIVIDKNNNRQVTLSHF